MPREAWFNVLHLCGSNLNFTLARDLATHAVSWSIHNQVKDALPTSGISYYYFVLHNCHQLLTFLWIIAMTMLMMGGVVREKAVGASSFTLALPVSRRILDGIRDQHGQCQ